MAFARAAKTQKLPLARSRNFGGGKAVAVANVGGKFLRHQQYLLHRGGPLDKAARG